MAKHTQKPKEDIKEDLKKTTEELEILKDKPIVEEEETPEPEPVEPKIIIPKEPEEEEEPVVEPEVTPEPEPEPEPPKEPDLKKKLSASARENQKIRAKNIVINKGITEAENTPEPTEDELKVIYPDWDVMSDVERTLVKETEVTKRWRATIKKYTDQGEKIEKWNEDVETFAEDPKTLVDYPDLEGKTDAFKEFAIKPENNSVPFNILIGAFLHEQSKKPKNKGAMFETGSGGPNDKPTPKSDKITLEEGRKLRETDYTKWKEYLKAGKIESDL